MKDIVKPGLILLIITAVAAGLLGCISAITKDAIEANKRKDEDSAMALVLDADHFDGETAKAADNDYGVTGYSQGYAADGKPVGFAVTAEGKGYGGKLVIMVGIDAQGRISGVEVLDSSKETPGLGAKANEAKFREQYAGANGSVRLKKDGGQIDAISGATITSKGVTTAVNNALLFYSEYLKGGIAK